MSVFSWLRSKTSNHPSRGRTPHRPASQRFRPRLEALEDRLVPSTLIVTNNSDSFPGSLRSEIALAQNNDTIVFAPNLDGKTISLGSELVIRNSLRIAGPGAGLLAVSGDPGRCRVFDVEPFAGLGAQVTLSGLTIENGLSHGSIYSNPLDHAGAGAGIYNSCTLTVSDCTIKNNTAANSSANQFGGGIFNKGILTVNDSTLSGNRSNFGGGVDNVGTLSLTDCTLSGNSAGGAGGGIASRSGTATLNNCTFSNNSAGGGGGGIVIPTGAKATLTNCTFANNSAHTNGGALNVSGSATLTNCTLSFNSANTGGGIWVNPANGGGVLNLTNAIVAGNSAAAGPGIYGAVATADHNLVGDATGSSGIVNGVNGNIVGGNGNPVINAMLGPLQNNGGPTQTMALLAGSPAIGNADNTHAPAMDERGIMRMDLAGEMTDIGAFEL